jgi:hypothetical protein
MKQDRQFVGNQFFMDKTGTGNVKKHISTPTPLDTVACGKCTACCTALEIVALSKPEGVRCEHLTQDGCGIYETRPEECRAFVCGFLKLNLHRKLRPDRAGFIITVQKTVFGNTFVLLVHNKINQLSRKLMGKLIKKAGMPTIWRTGKEVV